MTHPVQMPRASNGKYYTRQLFWEQQLDLMNSEKIIEPIFSLFQDKPGLINFGKAYVESEDPTGYKVAQELLGGYQLWTLLMKCKWFQAAKKVWDEELEARLASRAITKIKELLDAGLPAQQLAAAKYLAGKEYRKDKGATKGRPSKEQVDAAAREEAGLRSQLEDDFKRIRIVKS